MLMRHRHTQLRCVRRLLLLVLATSPSIAATDESSSAADSSDPSAGLPQIPVVGSTPLMGSDLNSDQVPETTRVLGSKDINRTGIPTLTGAILGNVASASVSDTEGNAFQPDISFRGFTASPGAGT